MQLNTVMLKKKRHANLLAWRYNLAERTSA